MNMDKQRKDIWIKHNRKLLTQDTQIDRIIDQTYLKNYPDIEPEGKYHFEEDPEFMVDNFYDKLFDDFSSDEDYY